jgi:GDP-4-dehydro-6-deoxy-D-mannose reductase
MPSSSPGQGSGRSLITGATGFVGSFLAEALLERGETVIGLSRHSARSAGSDPGLDRVELHPCDLCDSARVERLLHEIQPTRIYHLAGYARTGRSFQEPDAAWDGNLTATRRLYEAVARWGGRTRILFVGSGLIYGDTIGATEDSPLRPDSPYSASKAAADLVSYQFTRTGLDIVRARPCNHIGPRQSAEFAIPNFARQLAAIEREEVPPVLETGNLSPQRDLTDVRDVVAAYLLLMERGRTGEAYNIGTGRTYSMQTALDSLLSLSGRTVEVRARTDLLRPTDQLQMRVDAGKLRRETGWTPRYSLEQTLADTLAYWRQRT